MADAQQGTAAVVPGNVHTAFLTDCSAAADWQALAMAFSWRAANQPGPLTRIMSCTDAEAKNKTEARSEALEQVSTHVAPSYALHPKTGDRYGAYNKPAAVQDWLKHFTPDEEWVLLVEADMLLRRPLEPEELGLEKPGWARAGEYAALAGVRNQLARRHIPEVAPRSDSLAGPPGRYADQVGGFYLIHRDDLKRVAPFWLKYTEDVRADAEVRGWRVAVAVAVAAVMLSSLCTNLSPFPPSRPPGLHSVFHPFAAPPRPSRPSAAAAPSHSQAWKFAGDAAARRAGDKPWLAEVYGYAFGAAKADVWHRWDNASLAHAGARAPLAAPKILHYARPYELRTKAGKVWAFNKTALDAFDFAKCPPWNLSAPEGVLPKPPRAAALNRTVR